jgi:hypothetical protein
MGDAVFQYLDGLATCRVPLIIETMGSPHYQREARDVLAGRADGVEAA